MNKEELEHEQQEHVGFFIDHYEKISKQKERKEKRNLRLGKVLSE